MKKYDGVHIKLFGIRLLLHERSIKDAFELNRQIDSLDEIDALVDIHLKIKTILDALKFNKKIYKYNLFTRNKLSKILTQEYLYKNLSLKRLDELYNKVVYELEKQAKEKGGKKTMSTENMIQLVSKFSNISWEETLELSVSEFLIRLEQAINYMNFIASGKYNALTERDKQIKLEKEYEQIFGERVN